MMGVWAHRPRVLSWITPQGMALDVYFAFRLAFVDRPNARIRTTTYAGFVTVYVHEVVEHRVHGLGVKVPVCYAPALWEWEAERARITWGATVFGGTR